MPLQHPPHTDTRKYIVRFSLLAACLAFASPTLASAQGNQKAPAGTAASVSGNPAHGAAAQKTRIYEIMYMENMIDHHNMAVEMAQTCLSKASHAELKSLCQNIVTSQKQEIQILKNLLAQKYQITYKAQMSAQEMSDMRALAALNGAAYEKAFMQQMIQHHWAAIEMTVRDLPHFKTPQLVTLGLDVIGAQAPEIKQMRGWLCDWYKVCDLVPESTLQPNPRGEHARQYGSEHRG
ncbi:DUF305 domain-containing protein [Thermithiobacillus plumbiphilus]|uniref:DUF305 domain-containing protein n=1 Tax=Thermithiobacillus plumbiphilus TaxID=1729899 RepID=A0ABU9D9J3_9PROT